ncbi:hypothetical protein CBG25_00165 [Arsenophonus sp. ENCA]|uniref:hypothetical protein n=1 Tax=Arsenophonus sp. ENCA TaxID=1987579 RepID=UPI000BDD256C|nr:hypothetical protein [Arsenophonus sp. ENCA]PAV11606.1 hypothetical protein CBG25_00165 [Arsenophonus sp. ENCA]
MDDSIDITTQLCHPTMNTGGNENSCNDVILKLSKTEVIKLHSSFISNNPPLGEFDVNILGAGLGLVLIFYVLGYGLGRMIKMLNL